MNFGILGFGNIARTELYPAFLESNQPVVAIASQRLEAPHGFDGRLYGNYDELLKDDSVEAIYIATPNSLHVEQSIACMRAGKHVLCEKPLALEPNQVDLVRQVARETGKKFLEAFMVPYHPQWQWARTNISADQQLKLGVTFSYDNRKDVGNIRNKPETGGGALLDIGCYALWVADWLGARHGEVQNVWRKVENGVDVETIATIQYGPDVTMTFEVSMRRPRYQEVRIQTASDAFFVERPFNPKSSTAIQEVSPDGVRTGVSYDGNQYANMIEFFVGMTASQMSESLDRSERIAKLSHAISNFTGL